MTSNAVADVGRRIDPPGVAATSGPCGVPVGCEGQQQNQKCVPASPFLYLGFDRLYFVKNPVVRERLYEIGIAR
ncbi:MAG: hypothetical protein CMJ81_08315 [Planctomycetaceae bacterium]|nr:hypothetical protein [Planctomycetaceae bacterium]MBP61328.1 hypothetical protein [Planctomycetaceae bacterium]